MKISLPEFAIRHPITIMMILITVIGLGIIACYRMPLKFLPDLDFPFIMCVIPYPGATPEQVEREVAIPAEGQFATITHLDRISTRSNSNGCRVGMRFDNGTDMNVATAEVRDRIERLKLELPDEVDRVLLFKHNTDSLPVMAFCLYRGGDETEFTHLIRTIIQPRLSRLEGVAEVTLFSSKPDPEVLIEFDQDRLRSHNIALYQVISMLQFANFNLNVGELVDGQTKFYVRVTDELTRPEDYAELIIAPPSVRLKDVASVGFRTRERNDHYDMDGKGGAFILVLKESESNTVETCIGVKEEIERIKADPLFAGVESFIFFDQSELILTARDGLLDAGKLGGAMAILILFLFLLRIRPTLVVTLAIPTSLVSSLVYMFFAGLTLNLVTMVSLIVAVGMLVDNAIVVLENILRYHQMGKSPTESAIRGASEVSMAISASTVTTAVVFVPVLYMEKGEMAVYMREFAAPMAVALFASLFVALTLIPLAFSRMRERHEFAIHKRYVQWRETMAARSALQRKPWWSVLFRVHPITWIIFGYTRCLDLVLRQRLGTCLVIGGVLALTYFLPYQKVGLQKMPTLDLRQVVVRAEFDQNFDMAMATETFDRIKSVINKDRQVLGIDNMFTRYDPSGGQIEIHLLDVDDYPPGEERTYTTREVLDILWEKLPKRLPGVELKLFLPEASPEGGAAGSISVRLRGPDSRELRGLADHFKRLMASVPNISDVDVDREKEAQEIQLEIDEPRAESAGISPFIVARTVDMALRGNPLPDMKQSGREFPVWVQFREEDRKSRDNLDNVTVMGLTGDLVPLKQLVNYTKAESPTSIYRIDGRNVIMITGKIAIKDLTRIRSELQRIIDGFAMPPGYTVELGDVFADLDLNVTQFLTTLVMALILIYLVMSSVFESFLLPLSILSTVWMAFVGVYWTMYLTGTPLDTIGLIGCILMVGIIVNNGIVIVDHINFLRKSGLDRHNAVVQAGRDRFRPVWMTALTTILGCVPLALETTSGSTISFLSLGRALIGGLTMGTILTLVVVPVIYTLIDDAQVWFMSYLANLASLGKRKAPAVKQVS